MKRLKASRREHVALFRLGIIGDLLDRELGRGELEIELKQRAERRYRLPGARGRRRYHWKTLQRWYHRAQRGGYEALMPAPRAKGCALALTQEQREALLEIRAANPSAAAELILAEAVRHGIVAEGSVSLTTLRRLLRQEGLPRVAKQRSKRAAERKKWEAAEPGVLWHADVAFLVFGAGSEKRKYPVHGQLDDASRYPLALEAKPQERAVDMLEVFVASLLKYPAPKTAYVDNGACYRADSLELLCARLGIRLVHAGPHDPEARGKMERFWRTMRQRCTDHLRGQPSLHDINQALWAWLDTDYLRRPHMGLMGAAPRDVFLRSSRIRTRRALTVHEIARAFEVEETRRVKKDGTFSVGGVLYEVSGRHLAGKTIELVLDGLTGRPLRAQWCGRPVRFGRCAPKLNAQRPRQVGTVIELEPISSVPFDPVAAMLQKAREEGGRE